MRVLLLGTGSADGWPNAFCDCFSCTAERRAGRTRGPSSALVDDVLLVDCGPGVTGAAGRAGVSLAGVAHVLLTHGHPDHLEPSFLLAHEWAVGGGPLDVWGPAHALDLCRDWLGPRSTVLLHVVEAGDRLDLATAAGRYRVDALEAAHASGNGDALADEALLYAITAPDGHRLLYATDTGPLTTQSVADLDPVDLVLIDATFGDRLDHGTGHLDLATLPSTVAGLRATGVVTPGTRVVATHLSHHNPPTDDLRERLAPLGVEVPEDLDVLDTDASQRRSILVLGGARSGKSRHAEGIAARWSADVTYAATSGARADDPDWQERIDAHRARRPSAWQTLETIDLTSVIRGAAPGSVVLVDCLTLWLTGHLDRSDAWTRLESGQAAAVLDEVVDLAEELAREVRTSPASLVLVSNEVGWGVVPATASGRAFRDLMGRVNAIVAAACDQTVLVVAGRPLALGPAAPKEHP